MSLLDNAKEVATAVHEIKNLDLYAKVLDLNRGIMDLIEDNRRLHAEVEDLKEKFQLRGKMTFKVPFYYQDGDETPYCAHCWESKASAIHLKFGIERDNDYRWDCPSCHNTYLQSKNANTHTRRNPPPQYSPWG